ncbi:MAG: flagellar biosynthetic protein FliR [Polyangiaceae bacterium]|jgi:type III secretory pathway component EscT|nr:flagellar biosynthetic protein FliR [Polyangiaceae bacterium]
MAQGVVGLLVEALEAGGVDLRALGLGWARAAPVVAIVPAFGLRALPTAVRAVMALSLAACIAPALRAETAGGGWAWEVMASAARGVPVALAAAIPLWAATMAGGAVDAVRGGTDTVSMPGVEGQPTRFGVPMALLASTIFLSTGGPARVASALMQAPAVTVLSLTRVAFDLASGVQIAVAIAAPVLAASIVVEVAGALLARAASPAQIHALLAPLRSFAVLAIAAIVLDRMVRLIAILTESRPGP